MGMERKRNKRSNQKQRTTMNNFNYPNPLEDLQIWLPIFYLTNDQKSAAIASREEEKPGEHINETIQFQESVNQLE